ncbi:MAG: S-layer homology domain-containing protein, partial [Leptolyngbyaceae bacterium]|nr:S-layer homology domain-containing protein [Leptolyngbyaceae bacterium]
ANVFTKNSGNGVSVARAAQGEIRNNLFQSTGFGIAVGGTATPLIEGNQILQNQVGVVVSNAARPILRSNLIEGSTQDGVVAIAEAQPDLGTAESPGKNLLRNNTRYDLYNATTPAKNITIPAFGNTINAKQISGAVNFTAANVEAPSGGAIASKFKDVQGHWAQAYIEALAASNIISGFPDNTYRPSTPVTRAQFAAILSKAFTPVAKRSKQEFLDVQSNFWGYPAIQAAFQGGFMSGYPGRLFLPEQRIPRVQVLVSLASGLGLNSDKTSVLSIYWDATQIPSYAVNAVAAATQRQIVFNHPNLNELTPNREATRAEVAAFVYQALVNAGKAKMIPSPYLVTSP